MKGKVKQVTVYFYGDQQAFIEKRPSLKRIAIFDNNGKEIEDTKIEDQKTSKTIYQYMGNRIVDTTYSDGKVVKIEVEILDKADRLLELDMEINDPDMPPGFRHFKTKSIFKYDEKGNQTEDAAYDQGEKLMSKHSLLYNNEKQVIEENYVSYRASGIQIMKTINYYNAAGLRVKEMSYESEKLTGEGSISYSKFDQQGNWVSSTEETKYHSDSIFKDNESKSTTIREITYFQ